MRKHLRSCALSLAALAFCTSAARAQSRPYGDINNDGAINTTDAQAILTAVIGRPLPSGFTVSFGDADCNGAVNAFDAQILLNYVLKRDVSQYCVGKSSST